MPPAPGRSVRWVLSRGDLSSRPDLDGRVAGAIGRVCSDEAGIRRVEVLRGVCSSTCFMVGYPALELRNLEQDGRKMEGASDACPTLLAQVGDAIG